MFNLIQVGNGLKVKSNYKIMIIFSIALVGLGISPAFADDPEDRVRDILEDNSEGGTVGVYLKEVNGGTLADHNESFIFEPASTIKVTHHLKAMLEVQDNPAYDLNTSIDWFQDSETSGGVPIVDDPNTPGDERGSGCPVDSGMSSDPLEDGLRAMMVPSDNRWTQAMRVEFGEGAINAMMQGLGMTDSLIQHRIGCAADALANPNQLTLVDAGKLYEEVANGFLDDSTKADFYEIMIQDDNRFEAIVDDEVLGLGLSDTGIADFEEQRTAALKAGSYTLNGKENRTVAGWAQIPFKDDSCNVVLQEYVFGAFIHKADSLGPQDDIRTQGIELFREEIRAALESWADCETDLSIEKSGPANPVVAGEQITYTVTVENLGPNDATNVIVTDTLHPDLEYVSDTGGCIEGLPNTFTCDLGTIVDGDSASFDIVVNIPADYVYNGGSVVGNEGEVSSDQFDFNPDNNEDSIENDVVAEADVEILTFDPSETPDEVMLGDSFDVTLTKTITNHGVSSPVDVDAQVQASGDGVSIVPPQVLPGVDELEIDEEGVIIEEFTVTCEEPGIHEIVFTNEITPVDAIDPDPSNNEAEVSIEVDCVIAVQINIHPASDPNSVNIVKRNGVIPVTILSTLAGEYGLPIGVDATMVDPLSVLFGPADALFNANPAVGATEFHNRGHIEDSYELDETTQDGDRDMGLHFKAQDTGLDDTDTEGCVKGKIDIGGMLFTFFGCDDIKVTP
jgi:uncharacterized repeat protein (TIGR01451 family)